MNRGTFGRPFPGEMLYSCPICLFKGRVIRNGI